MPIRLVVIGGGFTGAVVAMNAVRATDQALMITVIEPLAVLGRGIAYGTEDPAHRTNVPSDRMNLFRGEPDGATSWLRQHAFLVDPTFCDEQGHFYVARAAYGNFVENALDVTLKCARDRVCFEHRRTVVTGIAADGNGWSIATGDDELVKADVAALCVGHSVPALPCSVPAAVKDHPKFIVDPWADQALAAIGEGDSVLIVGTGLTMADVAVSLIGRGHQGPLTAISRRGLLPRSHGPFRSDYDLFGDRPVPRTALGLLRLVRHRIRQDGEVQGWQSIVDGLRFKLPEVWRALPSGEKRKALHRLLPFWDVHRFRIAPQVNTALQQAQETGQLTVERAGLVGLTREDGGFVAGLKGAGSDVSERCFDAVVLCTGPEKDLRRNPLIAGLFASGIARLDETGLGLAVDSDSRIVSRAGQPWLNLWAFGPITRGTFGEMTGAPDIAAYVESVAPYMFKPAAAGGVLLP